MAVATASRTPGTQQQLQSIIKSTGDLPPMPTVAAKVNELATDPNSSAADFRRIVEADQALTARILRMANSAFYGLNHRVTTLTHAVVVLGFKTLQSLVVASASKSLYGGSGRLDGPEKLLWDHSVGTAFACRLIATEVRYPGVEPAFVGGLLHDIGKAVFLLRMKETYAELVTKAYESGAEFHALEQEAYGFSHPELGALLAQKWNLAPEHVEVIHDHHRGVNTSGSSYLVDIVRTANQLCHKLGIGYRPDQAVDPLAGSRAVDLGLTESRLERIGEMLRKTLEDEKDLF